MKLFEAHPYKKKSWRTKPANGSWWCHWLAFCAATSSAHSTDLPHLPMWKNESCCFFPIISMELEQKLTCSRLIEGYLAAYFTHCKSWVKRLSKLAIMIQTFTNDNGRRMAGRINLPHHISCLHGSCLCVRYFQILIVSLNLLSNCSLNKIITYWDHVFLFNI